jgi:hypothetical protein
MQGEGCQEEVQQAPIPQQVAARDAQQNLPAQLAAIELLQERLF